MLDKTNIRPSVSPLGEPILFVEKKYVHSYLLLIIRKLALHCKRKGPSLYGLKNVMIASITKVSTRYNSILNIADPGKDFVTCTNARKECLDGVLLQENHVMCYELKKMKGT